MTHPLRSPELMSREDSALLVVDVQEKLIPHIRDHERLVWNIRRLLDGAKLLGVPAAATEQYPQGLGNTVAVLRERLAAPPAKLRFSCLECQSVFDGFAAASRRKILLAGIEAHVCVAQTAHDLLAQGWRVYLAVDAIGSRHVLDADVALNRLAAAGAVLTTTEAVLFEWCYAAGTPEFKQISQLVREEPPPLSEL